MIWDPLISAASTLVPREHRAIWSEQWRSDMRDADELGISRTALASSMILLAISSFWGRPSGGRTVLIISGAILAVVSIAVVPSLAIVYGTAALFLLALAGVRRGIRESGYAAAGIVAGTGSLAALFGLLRERGGPGPEIAVAAFTAAVALVAWSFGLVWSSRTTRPRSAWVAVVSMGIATSGFLAASVSFVFGIRAGDQYGLASPSFPYGLVLLSTLLLAVLSLTTAIIAGTMAATRPRRASEVESFI